MTLKVLLDQLAPIGLENLVLPRHLLGVFRRKGISFCTGLTDERTVVYWIQSGSFTIDLRLPDGALTPLTDRQGWIGDTLWDEQAELLSWRIDRSYQLRNLWPEPARLHFIGNSVLEFAPSGAYVEDWRQQSSRGPLLGLRLLNMRNEKTGLEVAMDGGLVLAGEHMAYAQSRLPHVDDVLNTVPTWEDAAAKGVTHDDIESYEVSVAIDGDMISHSTRSHRCGQPIGQGHFAIEADATVTQAVSIDGEMWLRRYKVDIFAPDFEFDIRTSCTADATDWMAREASHLSRHAALVR